MCHQCSTSHTSRHRYLSSMYKSQHVPHSHYRSEGTPSMTDIATTPTTRSERTLRTILIADLERYRDATTIIWNKRWAQQHIDEQQKLQTQLDQNKPPTHTHTSYTIGTDKHFSKSSYGMMKCSRCGVQAKQGIALQTKCTGRFTYHDMRPL